MKHLKHSLSATRFEPGELYIFHTSNPQCPQNESLWGVFDKCDHGKIILESGSCNHRDFMLWSPLPDEYQFCRLATRSELRDYTYNIATHELERHSHQ